RRRLRNNPLQTLQRHRRQPKTILKLPNLRQHRRRRLFLRKHSHHHITGNHTLKTRLSPHRGLRSAPQIHPQRLLSSRRIIHQRPRRQITIITISGQGNPFAISPRKALTGKRISRRPSQMNHPQKELKNKSTKGRSYESSPCVELHTVTPKPALLLSLNKDVQAVTGHGALDINNRIVDASNKVTNPRLQHAIIETVVKVETAKPRTIQHHTKTITSARLLNLSKRSPRSRISRRSSRTINHDRALARSTHPHTLIISERSLRLARSTLTAPLTTKARHTPPRTTPLKPPATRLTFNEHKSIIVEALLIVYLTCGLSR